MDQHRRTGRFCRFMVLTAVVVRLVSEGIPERMWAYLTSCPIFSIQIHRETGQDVRFSASRHLVFARESPPPELTFQIPVFTAEEASRVDISRFCSLEPDTEALLTEPLSWDLTGPGPTVLILHTHTTESYTKTGEDYAESADYRTLEEDYNMVAIGSLVAEALEEAGIPVVHDRQVHDYPSYNGSYSHARRSLQEYLETYPSIRLVLDLHRDASGSPGRQLRTEAAVDGKASAQLMLVVGTNASGQKHPRWQENLALALKLHVQLERQVTGITRPLCLRSQRFNQDLSPGMLLVEVGAAGNTHPEAKAAAGQLAEAIISLSRGANISG